MRKVIIFVLVLFACLPVSWSEGEKPITKFKVYSKTGINFSRQIIIPLKTCCNFIKKFKKNISYNFLNINYDTDYMSYLNMSFSDKLSLFNTMLQSEFDSLALADGYTYVSDGYKNEEDTVNLLLQEVTSESDGVVHCLISYKINNSPTIIDGVKINLNINISQVEDTSSASKDIFLRTKIESINKNETSPFKIEFNPNFIDEFCPIY